MVHAAQRAIQNMSAARLEYAADSGRLGTVIDVAEAAGDVVWAAGLRKTLEMVEERYRGAREWFVHSIVLLEINLSSVEPYLAGWAMDGRGEVVEELEREAADEDKE